MNRFFSAFTLVAMVGGLIAQQEVKVPRSQPRTLDPDVKTAAPDQPFKGPDVVQPVPARPATAAAAAPTAVRKPESAAIGKSAHRLDPAQVYFDEPGDGSLWAITSAYKASFDRNGATYIPYLGAEAPKNYPVRFALLGVESGANTLALTAAARVERQDRRITIDRGACREVYETGSAGMEQMFVFASLPRDGELSVRIGVETELACTRVNDAWRFGNDLGFVTYDQVFAVDARGDRIALRCQWDAGAMTMQVPAAFLERAAFPVTVDPRIITFAVTGNADFEISPDIAFDQSTNRYLVVWEKFFSSTDHDVFAQLQESNGATVAGSFSIIDGTGVMWARPRVANHGLSHEFLVVATVGATPGRVISGRTRNAAVPVVMSNQFQISGGEAGDKQNADVGGDPSQASPTFWMVVWQRNLSATDSDIHAQQVRADGTLQGGLIQVDNSSATLDHNPSIAKSDGNSPSGSQVWGVVWQRTASPTDEDIRAAQFFWDGSPATPSFSINASVRNDINPTVSSITDEINGHRYSLVVWEGEITGLDHDIFGQLLDHVSLVGTTVNLSALDGAFQGQRQMLPHVDCDGIRFAVAHQELFQTSSTDFDLYVSTFHVNFGSSLGVSEARAALRATGSPEVAIRIVANRSGGGPGVRYGTVWLADEITRDVFGATYDGMAPTGGFTKLVTGCGGLGISSSGSAALGRDIRIDLSPSGVLLLGLPTTPLTICPRCRLGVDPIFNALPSPLTITVPPEGGLVGAEVAFQGVDIGSTCLGPLRLSDTLKVTIQ